MLTDLDLGNGVIIEWGHGENESRLGLYVVFIPPDPEPSRGGYRGGACIKLGSTREECVGIWDLAGRGLWEWATQTWWAKADKAGEPTGPPRAK